MLSSSNLIASFLLVGSAFAYPQFPVKRDAATCVQDNLLRCFINTKSMAAASELCAGLTPFTQTIATVTASASVTLVTTVVASTQVVTVGGQDPVKRSAMAPPNCYTAGGTTYAASRVTSACSCIGAPASTVLGYTYTASTTTATIVSTVDATSTSTTTAIPAVPTVAPVCGAPTSSNIVTNGDFSCSTIAPWVHTSEFGGDVVNLPDRHSLYTNSNFYAQMSKAGGSVSQTLTTIPGQAYNVAFSAQMNGGGGNYWKVTVGSTTIASNDDGQIFGFAGWKQFSSVFVAGSANEAITIRWYSIQWAYADWLWDNFVIAPSPIGVING